METVYKLTTQERTAYNGFCYEIGQEYTFPGTGPLCSGGWSHAYLSPELAVLLNPIHADFDDPLLWRAEGAVGARDGQIKIGCSRIRLIERLPLPVFTTAQRVAWAIACAWPGGSSTWRRWATKWLTNQNRTAEAAAKAAGAARSLWAAIEAAGAEAAEAARAAAVGAEEAAGVAAAEAVAMEAASIAAARAAAEAAIDGEVTDFVSLARWAATVETEWIEPEAWEG